MSLSFSTWLTSTLIKFQMRNFNYRCELMKYIIVSLNIYNFSKRINSKLPFLHNIHNRINNLMRVGCDYQLFAWRYLHIYMQRVRFLEFYIVSWLQISQVDMIPFRASWTYILIGSNPVSGKQFRPTSWVTSSVTLSTLITSPYYRFPRPSLFDKK